MRESCDNYASSQWNGRLEAKQAQPDVAAFDRKLGLTRLPTGVLRVTTYIVPFHNDEVTHR